MTLIQPTYKINSKTFALLPAKHIDYDTIAGEEDKTMRITNTPFQLVKRSVLTGMDKLRWKACSSDTLFFKFEMCTKDNFVV